MYEKYFFIGCVGAIAPEILRFYRLRDTLKFSWSWGYILISIVFVLLGGFVAYILEPSNNYAAFYSGVSTPFIINAIAKETQQATSPQDIPVVKDSNSDLKITVPDPEVEVTRTGKGINTRSPRQERETLQQIASERRKASLRDFFRGL